MSLYVVHQWYEVVSYLDNDNERKLACWLGPAEDYGGGDAAFLLPKSARPIVRSTFWALTPEERADQKDKIEELLKSMDEKIGDKRSNEKVAGEFGEGHVLMVDIFGEVNDATESKERGNNLHRSDADEYTPEAFDQYLTAEIVTDRGGELLCGTVKSRKHDHDGKPIGSSNLNPLLDSREYLECFEDGTEDTYSANLIAECLYSQIDDYGRRLQVMSEIIDHEKGKTALDDVEVYYSTKTSPRPKRRTRGWSLLAEWKDGSSSWVSLADMKDSYPVQTADYAARNNLTQEAAFRWWEPFTLKKRERILKKV